VKCKLFHELAKVKCKLLQELAKVKCKLFQELAKVKCTLNFSQLMEPMALYPTHNQRVLANGYVQVHVILYTLPF
jgi:hypothetical protein